MVVLFAACGIANAQPVAAAQSTVTSKSDRIERFVAEAALRFGIPTSWITAVMQAESRGVVRAVSPKGAMGLMQIMPDTWSGLRSRYGLGANPIRSARQHSRGRGVSSRAARSLRRGRLPRGLQCRPWTLRRSSCERPSTAGGDASLRRRARAVAARRRIGAGQRHHRDHPILDQFAVVSGARERRLNAQAQRHPDDVGETSIRWQGRRRIGRALRHNPKGCSRLCRCVSPGYELPSVSSVSGGPSDRFGCGCGGAEATNPRTAREKAGLRRGVCGWED